MKSLAVLLAIVAIAAAFEYRVGVGKDENTGNNGLGFDPSSIRPVAGDTIVFEFHAGTHSVIQSTFDKPCTPLSGGFQSGDVTVPDGTSVDATGLPTKTFNVIDASSLWFYDGAPGQCVLGGVLSVNPSVTGTQTAGAFVANAKASGGGSGTTPTTTTTTTPPSGSGSSPSGTGTGTGASASGASGTATPKPTSNAASTALQLNQYLGAGLTAVAAAALMGQL
ncbi:hypothetical protein BOTBODRAFT_141985 [Botryobasidium botryosum FD-172 SS1]|uniref:Phytocyanin domain-containing protein n=1 Tax=Botryobasidium botryosum (strain FD-172 SS1) TaxID=930990 RepID=A0A067N8G1_BOTB1|nr:hypothetical protein BOTBODRAFT_141985 [Botryobasidium botryosum FD-172 SS1]